MQFHSPPLCARVRESKKGCDGTVTDQDAVLADEGGPWCAGEGEARDVNVAMYYLLSKKQVFTGIALDRVRERRAERALELGLPGSIRWTGWPST